MMLIPETEDQHNKVYLVMPPNQMDWQFRLTHIHENEWEVYAIREYDFEFDSPCEYTVYYKLVHDALSSRWVLFEKN